MTIQQVSDYFWKEYGKIIWASDLFHAGAIHNTAVLLDIAKRAKDRNIQKAQCEITCDLCNYFTICNSAGDAKCLITNHFCGSNCACSCKKRCASEYIERIQKEFEELEYAHQHNMPEFLKKVVYNQDQQAIQEFDALTIEDMDALRNHLHKYIVESAKKSAQYDIEAAKQEYENAIAEAQKKVERAIAVETQFWANLK